MVRQILTGSTGKTVIQVLFGFLILSLFFWLMESLWPEERQQPRFRRGMFTDTLYFFFIIPATKIIATIGLIIGIYMTSRLLPHTGIFLTNIQSQPIWAQTIEVLFLGDLLGYWMHRIFHRTGILWPIHAIHHSSEQVDWLSSVRVHPLDTVISRLFVVIPLYIAGFSGALLAPYTAFLTIYAIYIHANVAWDYGIFRYVIASPTFHRWHHSAEEKALNANFSGLLPVIDMIFGTAYFPRVKPQRYGLSTEQMSTNLFAQLWYPFRRSKQVQ